MGASVRDCFERALMAKKRIDKLLVLSGIATDIEAAKRMVMAGEVFVKEQRVQNPSDVFVENIEITRKSRKFVGRGGMKLEGAFDSFDLFDYVSGKNVLDIGSSTGGFTDCCLQNGAKAVWAVDVGHGQLDWKLREDERVHVFERTDIRQFAEQNTETFQLIVGDISFNSITRLLNSILLCSLHLDCKYLLLIKPQFELPSRLVTGGIVKDEALQQEAIGKVRDELVRAGCNLLGIAQSSIKGRAGNQEYFCYFQIQDLEAAKKYALTVQA